ncbi:MAG: hypothetical protein PHP92_05530 [Candidatus Nanoarchaeia archaeon]|nr:hypothetical protein [Candidatus Nanoarchaeia archaeon]
MEILPGRDDVDQYGKHVEGSTEIEIKDAEVVEDKIYDNTIPDMQKIVKVAFHSTLSFDNLQLYRFHINGKPYRINSIRQSRVISPGMFVATCQGTKE